MEQGMGSQEPRDSSQEEPAVEPAGAGNPLEKASRNTHLPFPVLESHAWLRPLPAASRGEVGDVPKLSSICHSCGRTRLGFLVPASAGVLTLFAPVLWLFVEQISRRARSILFFLSLFLSCSLPPTKTTQTQTTFISCLFIRNTETKKQWDGIYKTVKG